MLIKVLCILAIATALPVLSRKSCASNNRVIYLGTAKDSVETITNLHNYYRLLIAHGNVTGQPQAANLRRISYDFELEKDARKVTLSCGQKQLVSSNSQWYWIGQNAFMEYTNTPSHTQNWNHAIKSWFDEQENYTYPLDSTRFNRQYTQLVWASTQSVGCDFALFYEYGRNSTPYGKSYTCIYGPGGNFQGQPPYLETTDESDETQECFNLC